MIYFLNFNFFFNSLFYAPWIVWFIFDYYYVSGAVLFLFQAKYGYLYIALLDVVNC